MAGRLRLYVEGDDPHTVTSAVIYQRIAEYYALVRGTEKALLAERRRLIV